MANLGDCTCSDEQIWARCDELHAAGIYPSKANAQMSCENIRFTVVRHKWAQARGVKLDGGRFRKYDQRRRLNDLVASETEIITRCRELVSKGIYPSFNAAALGGDDGRFITIRSAWVKAESITLPPRKCDPKEYREPPPRSHKSHAEQEQAKPKVKRKRTEWGRIVHILKRMEGRS